MFSKLNATQNTSPINSLSLNFPNDKKLAKTTSQNIKLCLMKTADQRTLLERLFSGVVGQGMQWYGGVASRMHT